MGTRLHLGQINEPEYNTTEKNIRIAVVGIGWFVKDKILPAIDTSKLCELGAVVSSSANKAEIVADKYGAATALTYDEFSNSTGEEDFDVVYIGTPNATHLEFTRTAANLGKHIICEKPMEIDTERAQAMIDCCAKADVNLMVAYRLQTDPVVRKLREWISEGVIGTPVQVYGAMTGDLTNVFDDPEHWRYDPEFAGGGAMIDVGVYPVNTTRYLLNTDPYAVQALTKSRGPHFDRIDEHVSFEIDFTDEPIGSFVASLNAYVSSNLTIIGTEGRIVLDPGLRFQPSVKIETEHAYSEFSLLQEPSKQLAYMLDYFADCIQSGRIPMANGHNGLLDIQTVQAVYESASSGNRVKL